MHCVHGQRIICKLSGHNPLIKTVFAENAEPGPEGGKPSRHESADIEICQAMADRLSTLILQVFSRLLQRSTAEALLIPLFKVSFLTWSMLMQHQDLRSDQLCIYSHKTVARAATFYRLHYLLMQGYQAFVEACGLLEMTELRDSMIRNLNGFAFSIPDQEPASHDASECAWNPMAVLSPAPLS